MKKTGRIVFSMLVASGLSVLSSSAQTHYSSNVSVGVKGGVDLSRVSFTPSVKQGFAMGGECRCCIQIYRREPFRSDSGGEF